MGNLKEALASERSRLFVGRKPEIAIVQNWLSRQHAPTEVLFLTGMGGIGKSALMLRYLNMGQESGALCIWLDARICTETPSGFLEALQSTLFLHSVTGSALRASLPKLAASLSRQKTLLCIDNYEQLHPIGGWLRDVFLPEMSAAGLLVVLASRQDFSAEWLNDLAWGNRVRQLRLAPLSRHEAQHYYKNLGLNNPDEIERLVRDSKGLPLSMALSAEKSKLAKPEHETAEWPVSSLVTAELLREVDTSDLQDILDLLCILPQASPESLRRLLGASLSARQLHQLIRLSFVRPVTGGFSLHDVARAHLLWDLTHREPARYQSLRLRIVADACRELKKADFREKKRISADLLSICRDSFQLNSVSLIPANPLDYMMNAFRSDDLSHLHRLVSEEGEVSITLESEARIHELLDGLAERFPESIRVFRSLEGIPLAFNSGVLLYRETYYFLEDFIPGVLDCCFPLESEHLKQLSLEEADTYYHLLSASTSLDPVHSFYELKGILITDGLSLNSAVGIRSLIVTKTEELHGLLQTMGFRVRPLLGLPETHPTHGAFIYELEDLGESVAFLLQSSFAAKQAGNESVPTENDVRTALSSIGNAAALGRTELARKLHCNGSELQQKVRGLLSLDPPPSPLNVRGRDLLRLLCAEPTIISEAAAIRLHISRPTYFRCKREAIAGLTKLLGY